ncbi:MAG: preprotein translocase subunit YajC [Alicyclobacillus sp.]|nr:preprotein translocase subunit YajC [Alicyclobacillus sp.]
MNNILLIVIMLAVFYALLILPQRRQAKKRSEMMQQLGVGAKVLLTSGIYGTVSSMVDDRVHVEIAPNVEIQVDNRAVMRVVEPSPAVDSEVE